MGEEMRHHRVSSRRFITHVLALSILMPTVVSTAAAADPAPVAHWTFDEGAGASAADVGPFGFDAVVAPDGWVPDGIFGAAINGRRGRAVVDHSGALRPGTITVAFWVRADRADPPTTGSAILEHGMRADCRAAWGVYVFQNSIEFRFVAEFNGRTYSSYPDQLLGEGLWDGRWHHVAISADLAPSRIRHYLDGGTGRTTFEPFDMDYDALVDTSLTMGAVHAGCTSDTYGGDLDDVQIFDRVLEREEVGSLMPRIPVEISMNGPITAYAETEVCLSATVAPDSQWGLVDFGHDVEVPGFHQRPGTCATGPGLRSHPAVYDAAGTYLVHARYLPGAPYLPAVSEPMDVVILRQPTTTLVPRRTPLSTHPFEVEVMVGGSHTRPNGLVTLYETTSGSDVLLGQAELRPSTGGGSATFALPSRAVGTYDFRAEYLGADGFEPSVGSGSVSVRQGLEPGAVLINGGAATTGQEIVTLDVPATGAISVSVSNNRSRWRVIEPHQAQIQWSLTDPAYGGNAANGLKTVYVFWTDAQNRSSETVTATITFTREGVPVSEPTVRIEERSSLGPGGAAQTRISWSRTDGGSGELFYDLALNVDGGPFATVDPGIEVPSAVRALAAGHRYQFRVRSVHPGGVNGPWAYGDPFDLLGHQETSPAIRYSKGWKPLANSKFWAGSAFKTSKLGANATFTFTGQSASWVAAVGPKFGTATVTVDGVPTGTVDLFASKNAMQRLVWTADWANVSTHTVVITVTSPASRPRVDLDGFLVVRGADASG